jgi:uncharacterized protein YdeI (YjbR/CyaY-like superfamily)
MAGVTPSREAQTLTFASREELRAWLSQNCRTSGGVWLVFGKAGGPKTVKASEALEEALCFGWIDGQMQHLDGKTYQKYFAPRREKSKWSEKNRALAESLEDRGLMTPYGREKIEQAKTNGQWYAPGPMQPTEEQVDQVAALLQGSEPACTNFLAMPMSVKKTYARAYFDAKTETGRSKRLAWLADRLHKNLRPMEPDQKD